MTGAYLSGGDGPHFERVVIGPADDAAATELEARDDMVVMPLQDLGETESVTATQ